MFLDESTVPAQTLEISERTRGIFARRDLNELFDVPDFFRLHVLFETKTFITE